MAKRIVVEIVAKTQQFERGVAKANASLGTLNRTTGRILRTMTAFVALFIARKLVAGIGEAVRSFAAFEKGMANIGILLGEEIGRLKEFQGAIEGLSMQFGITSEDILKAGFDIQSAVNDVSQSLDIMAASAALATAGGSAMAETTAGLLTLMESYGHSLEGAADASDLLLIAQEKARATIGELATSASKFLPVASQMGVKVEDLFAVYAQLTRALGNTREASTALGMFLNKLLKPTEKLKVLSQKTWGMSIQRALAEKGLIEVLKVLTQIQIEDLGAIINRQRAIKAVTSLTGEYGKMIQWASEMVNRHEYVQDKLSIQMDTAQKKMDALRETTKKFGREVGKELFEKIEKPITILTGILQAMVARHEFEQVFEEGKLSGKEMAEAMAMVAERLKDIENATPEEVLRVLTEVWQEQATAQGEVIANYEKLKQRAEELKEIFEAERVARETFGLPPMIAELPEDFAENMGRIALGVQSVQEAVKGLNKELGKTSSKVPTVSKAFLKMYKDTKDFYTATAEGISGLYEVFEMAQGETEKFKNVLKAIKIVETLIHTHTAVMKALAEPALPFPTNVAWASVVAGIGAAKVALIAGMQKGGIVPGVGKGDKIPTLLEPGELVIPKQEVSRVLTDNRRVDVQVSMAGAMIMDDPAQVQRLYREHLRDVIRDDIRTKKDVFY